MALLAPAGSIVLASKAEHDALLADLRAAGIKTWPDGRPLEDVLSYPNKR